MRCLLVIKRIIGIIIAVGGIVMIGIAHYIKGQVEEGKIQISEGQQQVDQTNKLFSMSPYTKGIGEGLTSSGQRQINQGKQDVAYYTMVANRLRIGGIVAIVVGLGVIFIGPRKKKKSHS